MQKHETNTFISPKMDIQLIQMPRSARLRFSEIRLKSVTRNEKRSKETAYNLIDNEETDRVKFCPEHPSKSKTKHSLGLFKRLSSSESTKARTVGSIPRKSTVYSLSSKPSRSPDITVRRLPRYSPGIPNRSISGRRVATGGSVQNQSLVPRFLSVQEDEARLARHGSVRPTPRRGTIFCPEKTERLPHAKELQLFKALSNEPLPFLDLHVRFGVSKQTTRGLLKRGLLAEVWGSGGVGLRFTLSEKGRSHLKQLEAAAKYKSRVKPRDFVRLKRKALL
jgi:hypothetical protein